MPTSRLEYGLDKLGRREYSVWNFTSYWGLCLIVAGRDPVGMDLGYDETGLKVPPTSYERDLARKALTRALKDSPTWPTKRLKKVAMEILDLFGESPYLTATDKQLSKWSNRVAPPYDNMEYHAPEKKE